MAEIEVSSDQETIITHCLRVRFLWFEDHWKHELVSSGGCSPIPRIWSVGAVPRPEDPAHIRSPFYQKLAAEIGPTGAARASLSGHQGPHHFSATFEVEERPEEVVVEVEVDDRHVVPADELAATYLVQASDGVLEKGEAVTITWHHPECRLDFEAEPPGRVTAHEAGMGTIRLQASAPPGLWSPSHRLKYRWRWVSIPSHQVWDRDA